MENAAQFSLNDAIRSWRTELAGSPAVDAAALDEMEGHLRDSIERLTGMGLSAEESFWLAGRRLGSSAALEREFAKVHRNKVWLQFGLWMVAGVILWQCLTALLSFTCSVGTLFGYELGLRGKILSLAYVMLYLGALSTLLWCSWRCLHQEHAHLRRLVDWMKTHPVTTGFLGLLLLLFQQLAPALEYLLWARTVSMTQYAASVQWGALTRFADAILVLPLLLVFFLARVGREQHQAT